jgi:hypothetical protein
MSYSTELTNPTSDKIALVEFDIGQTWNEYETIDGGLVAWVSYLPGIYYTRFDATYDDVDSYWLDQTIATFDVTTVGSVFYTSTLKLREKDSIATLYQEPAFYYDRTDEQLYIHLPDGDPPSAYNIRIGFAVQVSQKPYTDEVQGNQYHAELVSVPSIKKSIDPLFFGRISFDDATFSIQNAHGEYDNLTDFDIYGQPVRFYFGFGGIAFANFVQIWEGYFDSVNISETAVEIQASDKRRALQTPLPPNRFDTTTYTNLDDGDEDKPIPLAYGQIRRVVPTCVNKDSYDKASDQDFTFKLADMTNHSAIHAITTVYYNGEALGTSDAGADIYLKSTDLTNAEFVLNKDADVELDFDKVEVTFEGYEDGSGNLLDNGLEVIKDLIVNHTDALYNTSWFDTTTWASETTSAEDVYLWVEKESDLIELIESITASIRVQFDVDGDGLYTIRRYETFKTPVARIEEDELLEPIELTYDSEQWISRATVKYANGKTYVDASEESTIKERFKQARNRTFETVLPDDSTLVSDFAEETLAFSKELRPLVDLVTKTQHTGLAVEDQIYVPVNRRNSEWLGWTRCRVESVEYDYNGFIMTIGARILNSGLIDQQFDGGTFATAEDSYDGGTFAVASGADYEWGNFSQEYVLDV